jgi:hypothetical protein
MMAKFSQHLEFCIIIIIQVIRFLHNLIKAFNSYEFVIFINPPYIINIFVKIRFYYFQF